MDSPTFYFATLGALKRKQSQRTRKKKKRKKRAGKRSSHILSCSSLQSSAGKEPACDTGGPGLIPGSGRSPEEGIDYPLQYYWVSLVAQLVKNPPAMREAWVQSLGREDPLEMGKATHSRILACRVHEVTKSRTRLSDYHSHYSVIFIKKHLSSKVDNSLK